MRIKKFVVFSFLLFSLILPNEMLAQPPCGNPPCGGNGQGGGPAGGNGNPCPIPPYVPIDQGLLFLLIGGLGLGYYSLKK